MLAASDPADRVRQLIVVAETLIDFAEQETATIKQRRPPPSAERQEEKLRLANAFRLELGHIETDPALVLGAPKHDLATLKRLCAQLRDAAAAHRDALAAVKEVAEGLVHAMAEEISRQKGAAGGYGSTGAMSAQSSSAIAVDKRA